MKAEEIKFCGEPSDTLRNKINSIFIPPTSFQQIFDSWLDEREHSLRITEGYNDEVENSDLLCVILQVEDNEIAEVYFNRKDVKSEYPDHLPISRFLTPATIYGRPALHTDDKAMEDWERSLGFEYSDSLAGIIAAKQALIPYIIPYLMTEGGEIGIRRSSNSRDSVAVQDYRSEIEDEGIDVDQLLTVYSTVYGKEKNGMQPMSCGHAYIRTDKCLPLSLITRGLCSKKTESMGSPYSYLQGFRFN